MKKFVVMLLALVMVLPMVACGSKEEAAPTEPAISAQPKVESTVAVEDVAPAETAATEEPAEAIAARRIAENKALAESCVEKNVLELYELIGAPESSEYAPSCLVEGEDGTLYYEGFVVYTTREGDVETVYYVE